MIPARSLLTLRLVSIFFVISLSIYASVYFFDRVRVYDQKITSLDRISSPTGEELLPYARNRFVEGRSGDPIEWLLSVESLRENSNPAIWISHYSGHLVVMHQDITLYDSMKETGAKEKYRGQGALIALPSVFPSGQLDLTIRVYPLGGVFASLSHIYFGDQEDFRAVESRQYFLYGRVVVGLTFVQLFILVILVTLVFQGTLRREALGVSLIFSFFTVMGLSRLSSQGLYFPDISAYFLSLSPYAVLGLVIVYRDFVLVLDGGKRGGGFLIYLILCGVPFVFASSGLVDYIYINMSLSIPILVLGALSVFFLSLWRYVESPRFDIFMFVCGLWSFLLCLGLEVGHALGLIRIPFYTIQFGVFVFVVFIGGVAIYNAVISKKALVAMNDNLSRALKLQANKLNLEFARSSAILEESARVKRSQELQRELHDGVLTYLAIINGVSSGSRDDQIMLINKMSQSATNEIRLLLAVEPGDVNCLMIALNTFQRQLIEPLRHLGVKVRWSAREFLECELVDASLVLNVVRILQEGVHNAFFRANCTELVVVCSKSANGMLRVTMTNTGGDTYIPKDSGGFGIGNMHKRAAKIGGTVTLSPYPGGAVLVVNFPGNGLAAC